MSKIEEITNELMVVDSEISTIDVRIQREQGEIANTMNKAQSTFGDQQAGQQLVAMLQKTLQSMIYANGSLQSVKQKIHGYVQNIQK